MRSFAGYRKALKGSPDDLPPPSSSSFAAKERSNATGSKIKYRSLHPLPTSKGGVQPTLLAVKALGVGTAISVGFFGLGVAVVGWAGGCKSTDGEFVVFRG